MLMTLSESIVEDAAFAWPETLGYAVAHAPGIVANELGEAMPAPEDIFGSAPAISAPSSSNLTGSSPNLADRRDTDGGLLSDWLSRPIIDELARLPVPLRQPLEALVAEVRSKEKISIEISIRALVLALCKERFVAESAP